MTTSGAWILWLLTNLILLLSTRNPIYLLVTLAGLFISGSRLARKRKSSAWFSQNLRFLLTMIFISTLVNALFIHTGKTVLFTLPENWVLIGGDITLESMVYGATNGLVIGALYLLFNIFNLALSIKQIIRLIPRAFYPLAMIVTVALTFFPSIQQRAREIKEAQMIRGNSMKKLGDWLPILVPLLVTSLEQAILLSESMTARGFHAHRGLKHANLIIVGLILAVFSIFSGWILSLYDYPQWISILLYSLGGLSFITILILTGQQVKITHLHQEIWRPQDILASSFFSCSLIVFIILTLSDKLPSFSYSPYSTLSFPSFQWVCLLFSICAVIPVFIKSND